MGRSQRSLAPKNMTTGGSNVTQSQTSGNLFPSRKLKGNCTFTAQSTVVESTEAEEDLSVKPEGEEESESLKRTQKPQVKLEEQISW